MRSNRLHSILPAAVAAAALFTFACAGGEGEVAGEATPQADASPIHELSIPPRTVELQENREPGLEVEERKLAARQADLDARERRLKELERETRAAFRPTPPAAPLREEREETVERPAEPAPKAVREEPVRGGGEREEVARAADPEPRPTAERLPALITTATVPSGTTLSVEFAETVASNTHSEGDTFRVRVTDDIREDGHVVIPAGSEIVGQVTEAAPVQRKIGGQARLSLAFTALVLPSGARVPIEASFVQLGRNETGRDAATIGGGAAGGAILGRVLNKGNKTKGGTIGAIIGAAAGAVIASRTPGEEAVIPRGTMVSLQLNDPVEVRVAAHQRRWE